MNPDIHQFLTQVDREASRLSVQLSFGLGKSVICRGEFSRAGGYFLPPDEDSSGSIVVARGSRRAEWLHTLAHEYCHMWQWFRDDPLWVQWWERPNDRNYYDLEELTEAEAGKIIEKYKLPCGDYKSRTEKYLLNLRKSLGTD